MLGPFRAVEIQARGFVAAKDLVGKTDDQIRTAMGDKGAVGKEKRLRHSGTRQGGAGACDIGRVMRVLGAGQKSPTRVERSRLQQLSL